jgi:hypothetical protein
VPAQLLQRRGRLPLQQLLLLHLCLMPQELSCPLGCRQWGLLLAPQQLLLVPLLLVVLLQVLQALLLLQVVVPQAA